MHVELQNRGMNGYMSTMIVKVTLHITTRQMKYCDKYYRILQLAIITSMAIANQFSENSMLSSRQNRSSVGY